MYKKRQKSMYTELKTIACGGNFGSKMQDTTRDAEWLITSCYRNFCDHIKNSRGGSRNFPFVFGTYYVRSVQPCKEIGIPVKLYVISLFILKWKKCQFFFIIFVLLKAKIIKVIDVLGVRPYSNFFGALRGSTYVPQ